MALRYTLGNDRRLKREQHIETLFQKGKAFSVFPVRVVWMLTPRGNETSAFRVGFSSPKKKFKRATDRARVKRLLREAWRLQQHDLASSIPEDKQLHLFLLFTNTALPDYETVSAAVRQVNVKLKTAIQNG